MPDRLDIELQARLDAHRAQSLYRQRRTIFGPQTPVLQQDREYLSFCSNDYLGLANEPSIAQAFQDAIDKYGSGSGAAHLITGHSYEHEALEVELAEFTNRPRALLFSTGYMANMGVINALTSPADRVLQDQLNHASLLDGGWLSKGQSTRYAHNDMQALASLLSEPPAGRDLVVTDGLFSMDGDLACLPEMASLAEKYHAHLMVDDAHGIGVLGENGGGTVEHFGLSMAQVPILVGTLGKGFGTFGAFVAGSDALIESMIQFARTYIYTTATPPALAAATRQSLRVIKNGHARREHLRGLIEHFRALAFAEDINLLPSDTAVQPIFMGEADAALNAAAKLAEQGILITPIRPPTVPKGTARLRVTLSAAHTTSQVERLVAALAAALNN